MFTCDDYPFEPCRNKSIPKDKRFMWKGFRDNDVDDSMLFGYWEITCDTLLLYFIEHKDLEINKPFKFIYHSLNDKKIELSYLNRRTKMKDKEKIYLHHKNYSNTIE